MQDFTRSTSVQREKHKILFRPHPMIIRSSLHNPIATACPDAVFLQRCPPSVSRPSWFPWSFDVPFQNPASPTVRGQGCNIRSKFPYCPDACDRPRVQSSVVRRHLYLVVPPNENLVPGCCPISVCRGAHNHAHQIKSSQSLPAEGSPFRAQAKCRILPDQLVYNVKNTKSCFDRIQ